MLAQHSLAKALLTTAILWATGNSWAQTYPSKPIRLVTLEPGGGLDFAARVLAQATSGGLGQQVIVDNKGGAGGAIAIESVAKAPADGYTLLFQGSNIWILPLLRNVGYDPVKDFAPVTLAVTSPNMLVVHPSLSAGTVKELISLARAKPGQLTYASGGVGSTLHLAAELFKAMAGVNIVHVPYKGMGPAFNEVIGGQVQVMFPIAGAAVPHVKAGKLRALAVTSSQPTSLAPGLPTIAASGLPGYESVTRMGVFAPMATSSSVVQQLNQEFVRTLGRAEVKETFFNAGVETVGSAPQELNAIMVSEMARMGKVIKDAGIRAE
jgi:tripartite-type tricarboxylate transporter receptor subunit TctC